MGNDISGDDAFGPMLARKLEPVLGKFAIDAGLAPENWTGPITKLAPQKILIADAVAFGGNAGEMRIIDPENLANGLPATHGPGLGAFIEIILTRLPNCEIKILAVQPAQTGIMKPMSEEVARAVDVISAEIERAGARAEGRGEGSPCASETRSTERDGSRVGA